MRSAWLVPVVYFLAVLYLFPNFGYGLGRYFVVRQALLERIHSGRGVYLPEGANLSLFRPVSRLLNTLGDIDNRRSDRPDAAFYWLGLPPIVFVTACILSICTLNNALAMYLAYGAAGSWPQSLRTVVALAAGVILLAWYSVQLYEGMSRLSRMWVASVLIMSTSALGTAALLFSMDPLGSL